VKYVNLKRFGIELGSRESIISHAWLVAQSVIMGGVAVFVSYVFRYFADTYFHNEDRELVITGPLALLAILHSIIAGHMFMDVLRRNRDVQACVIRSDKETFLINKEVRLPGFAKFFLACLSCILVLFVSLIHFHNEWTNHLSVFCVTFVLSTYWVMITELEDPVSSVWFNNRIPTEWIIDIEETSCEG
jgi:hypothetical protein